MRTQIVLLFMCFTCGVQAQSGHEWERYLNEVMTAEDAGSAAWEDTYDLLCELEQHPLDINQATREQLEQLPFLSAQQVEEIVEYLYRYGPMKSLAELRMIRSLDDSRRRLLTYFIYIGDENCRQQRRFFHHELMATARIPFYERKGRNIIRLSNATNWLPDIDYIELFSTASSAIRPVAMQQQDDAAIYDLSGRKVANPHKGIYINNHRKVMK